MAPKARQSSQGSEFWPPKQCKHGMSSYGTFVESVRGDANSRRRKVLMNLLQCSSSHSALFYDACGISRCSWPLQLALSSGFRQFNARLVAGRLACMRACSELTPWALRLTHGCRCVALRIIRCDDKEPGSCTVVPAYRRIVGESAESEMLMAWDPAHDYDHTIEHKLASSQVTGTYLPLARVRALESSSVFVTICVACR